MPATPIANSALGESLLGIEPALLQQVDPGWRFRLNLFTGRALTDTALDGEQAYRAGLLATLGQAVTPGIVKGLAFSIDSKPSDPVLTVTPGYGIAASGQDVNLARALQTKLSQLAVIDATSGQSIESFKDFIEGSTENTAGVLLLQPIKAQVSGEDFDTGPEPVEVTGNLGASCDQDPEAYAFEDWQIADGARLVFLPWVEGIASLALPSPNPAATWRNRLAYAIFDAETLLGLDAQFPWAMLGVPLALATFDPSAKVIFVDRAAVVRQGGLPRDRYALPPLPLTPVSHDDGPAGWQPNTQVDVGRAIFDSKGNVQTVKAAGVTGATEPTWNDVFLPTTDNDVTWVNNGTAASPIVQRPLALARIQQLAEQVSDRLHESTSFGNLAEICTLLPPSGILPAAAVDFKSKFGVWFPRNWRLSAAPVHFEELESALKTGILADPIAALSATPSESSPAEDVNLLVPLSDQLYDPDILVTEMVAPDFQRETAKAILERNATLRTRKAIQLELNALNVAIGPSSINPNTIDLDADLAPAERAGREALPPVLPQPNPNPNLDQTFGTIGPATWQPNTKYIFGQFIIDHNGNIQQAEDDAGGTTGATPPTWSNAVGGKTTEAKITWLNNGPGTWQPNTAYAKGQFIFDANGSMQTVQANGTSGRSQYIWHLTPGGTTNDQGPDPEIAGVVWANDGPAAWQAAHHYEADRVVVDSNGNLQVVRSAGVSDVGPPIWGTDRGQETSDGSIEWINEGPPTVWSPNTVYALHHCMLDPNGNIQEVQRAGTSGLSQLIWNPNSGGATRDGAGTTGETPLAWVNSGPGTWQPDHVYAKDQFVLDSNGNTQIVQTAGKSGKSEPHWNPHAGQTTAASGVTWTNCGVGTWRPNVTYALGDFVFDPNGNVQTATKAGISGKTQPVWSATAARPTEDGAIQWVCQPWISRDLLNLRAQATNPPYTIKVKGDTIKLIDQDDWDHLDEHGLPSFIDLLNAKVSRANDLLDLAFLTAQTDIYRFRQSVLGADTASRLATSPVLANIAVGESATATAQRLNRYFTSVRGRPVLSESDEGPPEESPPPSHPPTPSPRTPPPSGHTPPTPQHPQAHPAERAASHLPQHSQHQARPTSMHSFGGQAVSRPGAHTSLGGMPFAGPVHSTSPVAPFFANIGRVQPLTSIRQVPTIPIPAPRFLAPPPIPPGAPTTQQITEQAPIVGQQLDTRTLTIAERLKQSPSQEGMFYAVANRYAFVQALLTLEIKTDDLQFLVDADTWVAEMKYKVGETIIDSNANTQVVTKAGTSGASEPVWKTKVNDITHDGSTTGGKDVQWKRTGGGIQPVPAEPHSIRDLLSTSAKRDQLLGRIQRPMVFSDADEVGYFSVGIRVVEQHTQLMRALEARVQTYVDFINLCQTTLSNIHTNIQAGQVLLQRLNNDLHQTRQNVAFTTALLGDEGQRVADINAKRQQVLETSVHVVAYTRPRAAQTTRNVPTRQLVPGSVVNPMPTCLQQPAAIPPELREIVALLHDAPVNWFPAVAALISRLDRPTVLKSVAGDVQARAAMILQAPLKVSSAAAVPSVYGRTIAGVYAAHQQVFRSFQTQRTMLEPAALAEQSWNAQVSTLTGIMSIGDLTSSESVHTEVAHATARIVQEMSSVATCLYTRANLALPIDRRAWADFLTGPGLSIQLQSLAVLPNWNTQPFVDRQQMQVLVDWLFSQVDSTNAAATAYMTDVVRVCLLLASHAPVNHVIAGAVLLRNRPAVGSIVSLNLPSTRVAAGMHVQLYSKGQVVAEAVVSDLDNATVTAKVTQLHRPGVYLEVNDAAHFTPEPPRAAALRPFAR